MSGAFRDDLWVRVRRGAIITLVALLIWLFAEAQSVSERTLEVRVTIGAPEGSAWVVQTPEQGWTGVVSVRIQGARAALDDAVQPLAEDVTLLVGAPGVAAQSGGQVIDLREALSKNPPLDRADVTVASVKPRTVTVRIDELTRLEGAPIHPALPGVATVGEVRIEPSAATLVLPARLRDRLGDTLLETGVTARLPSAVLKSLPEGGPQSHEVRLVLPDALAGVKGVAVEPATATLTFTVESTTERITLPSVPIWPMAPPTEINRWEIVVDPVVLRDVTLVGPSDVIERIRAGDLRVIATVRLSSDDLDQRIGSKAPVILGLPDSVRVESPLAPVTLTITPRVEAPAAAAAPQPKD